MKRIDIRGMTRVEGEGGVSIAFAADGAVQARLNIHEPPRLFESFLVGRSHREVPDMAARICGICPASRQVAACQAMEAAAGVQAPEYVRSLHRLILCGEWMESHALHAVLMHAPDFLGVADPFEMARSHREIVQRGLQIKRAGNEIKARIGGRPIHPVNLRIGGVHRSPAPEGLHDLIPTLGLARQAALETLAWAKNLPIPEYVTDAVLASLTSEEEYPMSLGEVITETGERFPAEAFESHIEERQVSYSNALQSRLADGRHFAVGPLARFALNFDRLPPEVQAAAKASGLTPDCRNPFCSILVRLVEIVYACGEALRLIEGYRGPDFPEADLPLRQGSGCSCVEAPRGLLFHRYTINPSGNVAAARIVTPTAMNQRAVESDIEGLVQSAQGSSRQALERLGERAVRNYDPCISCSVHALRM
jgi:coenzyme F420-reducing hydrogenase alpha subunit